MNRYYLEGSKRRPNDLPDIVFGSTRGDIADTVSGMEVTFDIDRAMVRRLADEAVRRRTTKSALVAAGLRRILSEPESADTHPDTLPPLPVWKSGGWRIDIANHEELYRIADHETPGRVELTPDRETGASQKENGID